MAFKNNTGSFVAISENIEGKQIWYNVKNGDIVDPKTPHGKLAAIKHNLIEIEGNKTPVIKPVVEAKKPKKKKK